MRLVTPCVQLFKQFAEFDQIHDPSIYVVDPDDRSVIDITEIGSRVAHQWEEAKIASQHNISPRVKVQKTTRKIRMSWQERTKLKTSIQESHREIRRRIVATDSAIIPRTQANNRKNSYTTIEEERKDRANIVAAQIRAWRSLLPTLICQFSRIPDPRKTTNVKHQLVMLLMYGLLAFIFQLSSRREMNRELTGTVIHKNLRKIFPEMDSIPHADTLARLLKNINPKAIESAHIELIKTLIQKKKFKKLLINGCLPISIDGTQKCVRDGLLNDDHWNERTVGKSNNLKDQQYVYVIEANITLKNGLSIPLMSEYLARNNDELTNPIGKEDCEITAFERLAERLKHYFPRLKILLCMDALYATHGVMEIIHQNRWEHMISLPKIKLLDLAKQLSQQKDTKTMIPNQSHYRGRQQEFYWRNYIRYGYSGNLTIHLVGCLERYDVVNKKTGEIEAQYSEHNWISSIPLNIDNVHELCNLGGRKKELIEDNINTEKNRGYHYKHAFAYEWSTMLGFHYLMRLGHAINALSEFTKKLKRYIKERGCKAILKFIKDTLFNPWLSGEWYEAERVKILQYRFQLE